MDPTDLTLGEILAAHRVEPLGFPGAVKCHACPDWTEGTIHDHHADLARAYLAEEVVAVVQDRQFFIPSQYAEDALVYSSVVLEAVGACGLCGHPAHEDDCEAIVGYDHLNGDHECGCTGERAA